VASSIKNALDVTEQAVLSADRRWVRISAAPVFTPRGVSLPVQVVSSVFPGSP
jgi:hypothetical protein